MAETGRTEDGGYAVRWAPNGPWEETDQAGYETAKQGRAERFARSAVSGFAEVNADVAATLNPFELANRFGVNVPEGTAPFSQAAQSNDAYDAARQARDPVLNIAGQVAGDPTMMLGGPAAARAGATAVRGSVGAVKGSEIARSITARVPAAAEQLPIVGKYVGELQTTRARLADKARIAEDARPRQGVGADAADAQRFRPGLQTADEFAAYAGTDIPDSMTGYLNASNSEASGAYSTMMKESLYREGTDAGLFEGVIAGERENMSGAVMNIQNGIDRKYMEKIGADPDVFPDVNTLGDNLRDVSAGFKEIEAAAKGPVDLDGLVSKTTEAGEEIASDLVDGTALMTKETRSQVDKVQGWIDDLAEENGTMTPENFGIVRNRLEREIARKAANQADTEVVGFLSEIREKLMDRFSQTLSPEDLAKDKRLRERWGWTLNGLNRAGAIGENGVNPTSLLASRGSKVRSTKTGRDGDEFTRFLRTADATLKAIPKSSQTAEAIARIGR